MATNAGPGATLGGQVTDTAHLSGGVNPTGTITFILYNNPNCAGTPAASFTTARSLATATTPRPRPPPRSRRLLLGRLLLRRRQQRSRPERLLGCLREGDDHPAAGAGSQTDQKNPAARLQAAQGAGPGLRLHPPQQGAAGDPLRRLHQGEDHHLLHHAREEGQPLPRPGDPTFKKKGLFRLPKKLTRHKMNKVRAAKEFTVQFKIPGTPKFCKRFFKRKLTIPRFIEGQRVWFQSGSVFGGDV